MRILWLSHLLPYPPKGGVIQRSYNLLKEVGRRHKVDLLAFYQRAITPDDTIPSAVKALSEHCRVLNVIPIPIDANPSARAFLAARSLFSSSPYTINWLRSDAFASAIAEAVSNATYDAAHFDTISLAPYRSHLPPTPASLTHHNIESAMLLRRAEIERNPMRRAYYWQEGRRLQQYERIVAEQFSINLTCSALDSERLREICPGARTAVIPNGVDTSYFDPGPFTRPKVPESLVFAGGLTWYPNLSAIRYLIQEIWPPLKAKHPNARVTIIGRRPPTWLQQASQIDSSIRVTGFVDDVRPYLAEAQAYICPIFDGGGTKLKVLDALAMGVPLVAHPIACEGISVIPEKHVLMAADPESFVSQISRLFSNPNLCTSVSRAGRELAVEYYDFATIGRQLSDLYDQLGRK